MNTGIWRRLSDTFEDIAQRLGDRIFVLSILCMRILADLIRGVVMACLMTIAPAGFFVWILSDVVALPFEAASFWVAFLMLMLGSWFLLGCIFGPVYSRITERSMSLYSAIDDWLKREKLSGTCRGISE